MAFRDGSKLDSFRLWVKGKPLDKIQGLVTAKAETVAEWILDWERGRQELWTPKIRRSN